MTTAIRAMHRFGARYLVTLDCGHRTTVTTDDVERLQLYIGKRITCEEEHELSTLRARVRPEDGPR